MSNLSQRQIDILRHSVGFPRMYRNHFVTGPGSADYDDCIVLVEAGMMARRPGSELTGGDDLFVVTDTGKAALRQEGEA